MKTAFVYAGQGSQHVGMGYDLYTDLPVVKARLDMAEDRFGGGLLEAMFKEGERLKKTACAQPAIYAMSVAVREAMKEEGFESEGCAGLSLGEYAAFHDAGLYTFAEGFDLVRVRGRHMSDAAQREKTSLVALIGGSDAVEALLQRHPDCHVANRNLPMQTVVGGPVNAMARLMEDVSSSGVKRAVPLAVEGAFHTPYMQTAADAFERHLEGVVLTPASKPLYLNLDGRLHATVAKRDMTMQMTRPVRFFDMIATMLADGYTTFVEIGPGKTLSGLIRKIDPDIVTLNIGTIVEFHETIRYLKGMSQR